MATTNTFTGAVPAVSQSAMSLRASGTVLCAVLLFTGALAHAQRTAPLTCRGGPAMSVTYVGALQELYITFEPGAGPQSPTGLQPGQCRWLDRAVHPHEPRQICHRVQRINLSWNPGGPVAVSSAQADYVRLLHVPRIFHFHVYDDVESNPRCLRAIRVEPISLHHRDLQQVIAQVGREAAQERNTRGD